MGLAGNAQECETPGAPCLGYATQILDLIDKAEKNAACTLDLALKCQTKVAEVNDVVHQILKSKSDLLPVLAGIKTLLTSRFPQAAKGAARMAVLFLVLPAVLLLSSAYSAAKPEVVVATTQSAGDSTERACAAMRRQDYAGAASLFREAFNAGGDPDHCLGRLAECQYRMTTFTEALATCDELESRVGNSIWAPFIRGLVFKKQGRVPEARFQFDVASIRGHPYAKLQLKTLK